MLTLGWLVGLLGALALVAPGVAAAATKIVRYHGLRVSVPGRWPVFHLGRDSRTCVRFDRHAVYLGRPGADQLCPPDAAGRTEAILVSPAPRRRGGTAASAVLAPTSAGAASAGAASAGGSVAQVARPAEHLVVTATWGRDPALVRAALGVRSTAAAARAYARRRPTAAPPAPGPMAGFAHADAGFPVPTAAGAGSVYTGLGFDACSTPSTAAMSAWHSSPFRAIGIYIGGANMACSQSNLTAGWVSTETDAGWHLIPIYVGLQAPANGCGCAAIAAASATTQGAAAAQDAISHAKAVGLGPGNPVYFDMENYARGATSSAAVLAFLSSWTTQLHHSGYLSGVYSSDDSGIRDLVAEQGTGYAEPDDIWFANWNGQQSTADGNIPSTDWGNHGRLHQFEGGHVDDYGGTSIDIDGDYLDAATASAGSGSLTTTIAAAPSISVRPQPNGAIDLYPSWSGTSGVSRWRIFAGASAAAVTPTVTARAASRPPIVTRSDYPYYQVQALNPAGQLIGSSGIVATAAHVAMFGNSSFVPPHGPGGLPVACYGITGCRVSSTVSVGPRRLAQTGLQAVPAGGGIVHFDLSGADHRLVVRATGHRLAATVTVRSSTGATATRAIGLVPFTPTGRGPRRSVGAGSTLRILGATDFVSRGWVGGILAACVSGTPCSAIAAAVTAGGRLISQARAVTLGAGQIGYLPFRMTGLGHRLLTHASGNQLGVRVTVRTTAAAAGTPPASGASPGGSAGLTATTATASALVSLSSF